MALSASEEKKIEGALERAALEGMKVGRTRALVSTLEAAARRLFRLDRRDALSTLRERGVSGLLTALPGYVESRWLKRWKETFRGIFEDSLPDGAGDTLEVYLDRASQDLAKSVPATTAKKIRETLTQGLEKDEGDDELVRRVEESFDGVSAQRARLIARSESAHLRNAAAWSGAVEVLRATGTALTKTWRTQLDSRVREVHEDLEGVTVGLMEEFPGEGQFPSSANERCWLEFDVDERGS